MTLVEPITIQRLSFTDLDEPEAPGGKHPTRERIKPTQGETAEQEAERHNSIRDPFWQMSWRPFISLITQGQQFHIPTPPQPFKCFS